MPKKSWKYHKIMSIYKRNKDTGDFIIGEYSTPEIEFLWNNKWEFTEKIDGTNIRIKWDGKTVEIAGRSDNAQLPVPLIQKLDELFKTLDAMTKLKEVFGNEEDLEVILYGEGFGGKIQSGSLYGEQDFVLFDVVINGMYLQRHNVNDIAEKLKIQRVPILGQGTMDEAIEMCKKGFNSKWGDFIAEGIVARPVDTELFSRRGDRIITKIKYKDFNKK